VHCFVRGMTGAVTQLCGQLVSGASIGIPGSLFVCKTIAVHAFTTAKVHLVMITCCAAGVRGGPCADVAGPERVGPEVSEAPRLAEPSVSSTTSRAAGSPAHADRRAPHAEQPSVADAVKAATGVAGMPTGGVASSASSGRWKRRLDGSELPAQLSPAVAGPRQLKRSRVEVAQASTPRPSDADAAPEMAAAPSRPERLLQRRQMSAQPGLPPYDQQPTLQVDAGMATAKARGTAPVERLTALGAPVHPLAS